MTPVVSIIYTECLVFLLVCLVPSWQESRTKSLTIIHSTRFVVRNEILVDIKKFLARLLREKCPQAALRASKKKWKTEKYFQKAL